MKKKLATLVLTSYEQAILQGFEGGQVEVMDDKRTQKLVDRILNTKIVRPNEDGTESEHSVEEILIAVNIAHAINRPKGLETIVDLQKIRGEAKEVHEVNISLVDERLKNRGFKKLDAK